MKKKKLYFVLAVCLALAAGGAAVYIALKPEPNPAILKNSVIMRKGPLAYMEVRHIVLKGSNKEIGQAIADIARRDYRVELVKYASPVYARARYTYMRNNYPALLERMKGVAESFGIKLEDTDMDTSSLYYSINPPECSSVFFPADVSESGGSFYVCNRDCYPGSVSEAMGLKRKNGEEDIFSRAAVIELYPDEGYPSIGIAAVDLMNMRVDAVNSMGLGVALFKDATAGDQNTAGDISRQSGLSIYQAVQIIMDTCSTADEAKEVILSNKITMSPVTARLMVMDSSGRSFLYERSPKDHEDRFTDWQGEPVVVTNHSAYEYPSSDTFPDDERDGHGSFKRYRTLEKYVKSRAGKFSESDGTEAMELVYERGGDASGKDRVSAVRTLYTALVNMEERSIKVKFYARDGKKDRGTGLAELVFSKPFEFKIEVPEDTVSGQK
ncbi:MAG TPA: C45 family autoproteolytic acyltransferase/hydrolase [Candidatus Omnitrophota bacterium]|nr:C45 family autoproteolytic acyltransferase/hydrolase [Candidatus Omnitrophota bacterium]